jgi:hypothetical protein
MSTPEEAHLLEKRKHSRGLSDKNRYDHVQRTTRLRRLFARVRDHVESVFDR